jgi:hypothetical protein
MLRWIKDLPEELRRTGVWTWKTPTYCARCGLRLDADGGWHMERGKPVCSREHPVSSGALPIFPARGVLAYHSSTHGRKRSASSIGYPG